METLRAYLMSLPLPVRTAFAVRCGTTLGYLRKAIHVGNKLGGDLAVAIDRESGGAVRCEVLRPDIDWTYVRTGVRGKPFRARKSKGRRTRTAAAPAVA